MKTIIHNGVENDSALRIAMLGRVITVVPLHIGDIMDLGMAVEYVRENGGAVTFADMDGVKV